ncbi:hypothetical protein D3C84_1107630 [compost metagenome]
MAAAIVGDDTKALAEEIQHLCIPVITGQGPAMVEHNRLAGAPVLVENARAILDGDLTGIAVACAIGWRCSPGLLHCQRRYRHGQGGGSHGTGGHQGTTGGSACLVSHYQRSCEF